MTGTLSSMMILMADDVDFYIKGLFKYATLFGQDLWITTTHVGVIIIDIVLIVLMIVGYNKIKKTKADEKPGMLVNCLEMFVGFVDNMVTATMGVVNGKRFRNWICILLMFILVCNISGLFGLRAPTADYGVTFALGVITFFLIQVNGLRAKKWKHVKALFEPSPIMFPSNVIGEVSTPISLSLRLFGNIMSGTIIMGLLYGLLPTALTVGIPAVVHIYCDMFSGVIQAYVFSMLTMVYINDKIT